MLKVPREHSVRTWEVLVLAPFDIDTNLYNPKKSLFYRFYVINLVLFELTVLKEKNTFEKIKRIP